mmetsp:Transcript_21800/g.36011  ORF Transcript_21800/g.36011 Transcript_21800/m.36011 type:complete len:157 (-) Transcript_21800:706-1176(-)
MLETFPSPLELKGAVQGTLLYLGLYSCILLPFQSFSKVYILAKKKKEAKQKDANNARVSLKTIKYYSHDTMALRGDRTVGNFLEQGLYYLPLFWLHALFVDPTNSFTIASIYTASRAVYPFVFGRKPALVILISTVPCYLVNAYLMVQLLRNVAFA